MRKKGFNVKSLGKNGKGIYMPINICISPRKKSIGYECQINNRDIKFVKEETSIEGESSTSSSATNHVQNQRNYCSHYEKIGHVQEKFWNFHPCNMCGFNNYDHHTCWQR
jgi:hypothetical protein